MGSGAGGKNESQTTFNNHKKQYKEASHVLFTCKHKEIPISATSLYSQPLGQSWLSQQLAQQLGNKNPSNVFT